MNLSPVIYTFRRCPYAIRARLAIKASGLQVEVREILLRNKPQEMLELSPKGTVPVLLLPDGDIIDESIDIVRWALKKNDPFSFLDNDNQIGSSELILINDQQFKPKLDLYKYSVRFPEKTTSQYLDDCQFFLELLDERLSQGKFLCGNKMSIADLAIFPFIRQFASVDRDSFSRLPHKNLQNWLNRWLQEPLYLSIMTKYLPWEKGQSEIYL